MAGRTIAIGDVHGSSAALAALIDAADPGPDDTVVTLGDLIDRGPDSRGVLDRVAALARPVPAGPAPGQPRGDAARRPPGHRRPAEVAGVRRGRDAAVLRLGPGRPPPPPGGLGPRTAPGVLADCRPYYETATHLFVHAGFVPELPMEEQPGLALRWRVTDAGTARPHGSGKTAVVGHTPQHSGEVLDLGFLVCIDTNCVRGGWLTALDTTTGRVWQADREGRLRVGTGRPLTAIGQP